MKRVFALVISLVLFVGVGSVSAITIEATLTADNHYALYYGDESGVTFVGRNEVGESGNPGEFNWSLPENWTFNVAQDDYIYVAAWSDNAVAQGWIGQFDAAGTSLLSNTTDWEVYLTCEDLGDGDPAPSASALQAKINGVTWSAITNYADHGDSPWGNIAGISMDADWIWGTRLQPGGGCGEYQIFRTKAPVPEPATFLLFGAGILGLVGISRSKRN